MMNSSIFTVQSFILPNSSSGRYNHGMVRRIIESTQASRSSNSIIQQQEQYENVAFSSLINCNSGAFGYCHSWG